MLKLTYVESTAASRGTNSLRVISNVHDGICKVHHRKVHHHRSHYQCSSKRIQHTSAFSIDLLLVSKVRESRSYAWWCVQRCLSNDTGSFQDSRTQVQTSDSSLGRRRIIYRSCNFFSQNKTRLVTHLVTLGHSCTSVSAVQERSARVYARCEGG